MITITIKYLGDKVDTVYNGFFNALGKEALRGEYINIIQNEIKNLNCIEEVIAKIKIIEDRNLVLTSNTVFIISINIEEYYLLNNFELISKDEFMKLNFTPFIKFDKSNSDITREEGRINKILRNKDSDEANIFIENYISNLPKFFRRISIKPNRIFLYDSFNSKIIKSFKL
jgi:hypothetical protein